MSGCASREAKAEQEVRALQKENNAETLFDRGRAYAFVGDQTRAEDYLTAALDAGGDPRKIMPLLLDVCIKAGRYRSAIQHGEDQLRKHPNDGQTRLMVGALYVALNEPQKAKEQLEIVIDKPSPDLLHGDAHYYLGVISRDDHDPVEADKHFREYLRIEPHGSHVQEAQDALLKEVPHHEEPPIQTTGVKPTEGATP